MKKFKSIVEFGLMALGMIACKSGANYVDIPADVMEDKVKDDRTE